MKKEKIAIGLDLGTTSVGWSVLKINSDNLEKKLEILNMGVRLFDDPASLDSNNETRRIARGRRRRINRLKIRKEDLFKLLKKYRLINNNEEFRQYIEKPIYDSIEEIYKLPVEIKIKGLSNELSVHELVLILHNYIKHRGTLNTIDLDEEEQKEKDKDRSLYNQNLYPCENQWNWFKSSGKILGNKGNYLISNDDFKKEIKKILLNQKSLGISDDFIEEFIRLFERHRHYSEGPGSEKSPTEYGRFKKDEKGNLIWQGSNSNLWDLKIGKCTYYPNENRNYKKSPITEFFNLLNDLSNIKIFNEEKDTDPRYLTVNEKKSILSLPYDKLTLDKIIKEVGYKKEQITSGLKKDKKEKFVIEELRSLKGISKWLIKNRLKEEINFNNLDDIELINNIFQLGVKYQNVNERYENLIKNKDKFNISNINDENIKELSELKIWSSGTSSLSKKAQLEFIKFSLNTEGKNQMEFFANEFSNKEALDKFSKYKYFPENYFKNEIMSLTVKRTFNQTMKVINAILKQYNNYELSHIIIELARELNSEDEKKKIENELKKNKDLLNKQLEHHGLTNEDIKKGENRLKFLLWCQQNRKDIYDGEEINLKDLLNNPTKYHIDHILPISISFIDSMQNKVLTKAINNEKKGDKTPYQWLSSQDKYDEYKERCNKLIDELSINDKNYKKRLENKIKNYLLYEKDPFDELNGFVSRQLNDTRYISSEISNQLKTFFKQSNEWKNKPKVIIQPVNGAITSFARNNLFKEQEGEFDKRLIFKNRDIYNHHAIDASIIAYLGLNHNMQNLLKMKSKNIYKDTSNNGERYIDRETGEVYAEKSDFLKDEIPKAKYFLEQMRDFLNKDIKNKTIKFSRMIVSKNNLPLANETLYSIKNINKIDYKISKINILNLKTDDLKKYFGENPTKAKEYRDKLLMFENDNNMYQNLNEIFINFLNNEKLNENPFINYLNSELVISKIKEITKNNNFDFSQLDKIPLFDKEYKKILNWVGKIKIKENEVEIDNVLTLKEHKNKAFYDSLNPVAVRIYKNRKNKYQLVFINALCIKWDKENKKIVVNQEKLNNILNKLDIDIKSKFIEAKRGMPLLNLGEIYYFNGGGNRNNNTIEIKSLLCKNEIAHKELNWINAPQRDRWQISISTIANNFKLCKVDVLGNIYDVKSFEEFFKEK